ncbi:hypothetical protein KFL_002500030 [Klebsormidium nitens]|uniref:UDP-N-acetylmuramate--L-alanine ligase n=1 Tax=Klebsormidium nitens TaxID=105231 RepID=A0A1Y1I447_KLENI|nr:hypothetical protein KFL_002500030 [Klebsormidium nitens]|eukprot:GAQ85705.1 hypothetical protein KFL_002500030 [Klebsormidium nitens]
MHRGIGGSGLSALALVASRQGWKVTGSDLAESQMLISVREAGITAHVGHSADHITDAARPDVVVVSSAIPDENPEIKRAKELGVQVCKRSEWLGLLTAPYKLLAVAGSHGKTSTSAMLAVALRSLGKDVTAVIGGEVFQFPNEANAVIGSSDVFVLESDEYDGAFLDLRPRIAVVTNVEWEHVDIFPDEESVRTIFRSFVQTLRPGGVLLLCNENPGSQTLLDAYLDDRPSLRRQIFTYGLGPSSDFRAEELRANARGGTNFAVTYCGRPLADVSLGFAGTHMVLNALAVLALVVLHINEARPRSAHARLDTSVVRAARQAAQALGTFQGVKRRFELVGEVPGLKVYDDYAHHPTEVRATLQAARQKFPNKKIWVVFQPHTYSRLAKLLPDFAPAFTQADRVIVTEVYSAREKNVFGVSGKDLATSIKGVRATFIAELDDVVQRLASDVLNRDLDEDNIILLNLGAGDITRVGPRVLSDLTRSLRLG